MLAFLHTSFAHVETFEGLLRQRNVDLPVRHYVEESLLQRAKEAGTVTPSMQREVERAIAVAFDEGVRVLLCTCSTIGAWAERFNGSSCGIVLRVDRPMIRLAVASASKIAVIATLKSTLPSTRELLQEEAKKAGKTVSLEEVVLESAWAAFEAGDREEYLRTLGKAVNEVAGRADAVVLAQASMRGAERYCGTVGILIYNSPETGLEEALRLYSEACRGWEEEKPRG
jgi:hypothetical protein